MRVFLHLVALTAAPLAAQQPDSARSDSTASDTITLRPVVITGRAADRRFPAYTSTATKTDRPLRDVPQAVTVLSRDVIADQAMQGMADLVRYIPGVSMGQGEGHRDAPTIRGNSSTADFFVDGVRDDAQYLRDLYNVDRVEALKGSNAMVFGRGGGGGVINRVTKTALFGENQPRVVTFAGGSFEHKRTTIDVGQSFSPVFAVRLNGVLEGSASFRDATTLERNGFTPTAAIRLDSITRIQLDYEHFTDHRTVNRGIPSWQGMGRPAPAPIAAFFGDPNASRSDVTVNAGGVTFERGTASGVRIRNRTRFAAYDKFYQNVYPGGPAFAGLDGVTLAAYYQDIGRSNLFNQTDVTYAIAAPNGQIRQTFLVGAELGRQASTGYRATGYFNTTNTADTVSFAAPMVTAPVTFRQSASDANNETTALVAALYAQHEITLGAHWQAIVGIRYDRFSLDFHNNRTDSSLSRVDNMVSPRAGLVFKPVQDVSLYGSYTVSSLPSSGDQFGSLTVTSSTLEPERFTNREAGLKWDVAPNLAFTAALYLLDRTNTTAPDPNNSARVVQTGQTRSKGFEAGLSGMINNNWLVTGSVAVQRARIASRTSAALAGAVVPLVPNTTVSLWNRYDFTKWLGAGLGVIHQADMFAAIDNTVTLPAFTRVDLAAFVNLGQRLGIQINVENLFDTRYYATSHGNNNIMPGAPRTVRLGINATP